jgi:hypothetical protein
MYPEHFVKVGSGSGIISAIGESVEWKSALSPTAPNELNPALPQSILAKCKTPQDTFFPNKKGLNRPKNHFKLLSL